MTRRYDGLASQSRLISGQLDLMNFAKNTPVAPNLLRIPKKVFAPPQPPQEALEDSHEYNVSHNLNLKDFPVVRDLIFCILQENTPIFKNELIIERESSVQLRPSLEALRREQLDLDAQTRQLQVSLCLFILNLNLNKIYTFITELYFLCYYWRSRLTVTLVYF